MQRTGSCLLCIAERREFKFPVVRPEDFTAFVQHAQEVHGIPDYILRDTWRAPSSNPSETWLLPGKVVAFGSDEVTSWLAISSD